MNRHEPRAYALAASAAAAFALVTSAGASAADPTEREALSLLRRHCGPCHGAHQPESGLDLRSRTSILAGGKSGAAVVPGKPSESLLVQRVRRGEMPPRDKLVEACVKPVEPADAVVIERWIEIGMPAIAEDPRGAESGPDPLVTDPERDFWSFRPPAAAAPPTAASLGRAANPVDAFLLEKLGERGLSFSPEAARIDLYRRASFDLTGLALDPDDAEAFLGDPHPSAYEQLVDRLLASPGYGERWGRFWLDLAGYADSEGKREQDLPRPHAYRYRDYVIRAFNADKPYDRFVLEQLAGDEIAPYEDGAEITPEVYDNLVATGFLRMAPDATWANITGFLPDRMEVIADEIDVLGSALLGLTVKCARCHDHKIEPIPQRDYYRLLAVFKGAFDEHDWLKPEIRPGIGPVSADRQGPRNLPHVTAAERREWEDHEAAITGEVSALRTKGAPADVEERCRELEARRLPEPRVQALWDRGNPSPTHIYLRGDSSRPGLMVTPGVPSVLADGPTPYAAAPPWPGARQTGRRLAFARWLVEPAHPLTARVAVNRIWKHHFGAGIVRTLDNLGRSGANPTHPLLLDWLARELVRGGYSIKAMHRLMMTSAAYRQTSLVTPAQAELDPENAMISRMPLRRLDAEEVHDALLQAAGRLERRQYGPADAVAVRADGLVTSTGTGTAWRRAVYVRQDRKYRPTILEDFDLPLMNPNCSERRTSNTATQALHLLNNAWVHGLAAAFADRVVREAGSDPTRQVERAYRIAFSRPPRPEERELSVAALCGLVEAWSGRSAQRDDACRQALAAYCHALLCSAAFLYVD